MRNKKRILCGILLVICFISTGCGEKLITLSDDESAAISQYAAKVISKYNKTQDNGLYCVASEDEPAVTEEEPDTEGQTGNQAEGGTDDNTDVASVSLADALKVSGIHFTYQGFEVQTEYQGTDYYMLTPNQGYSYLVLNIQGTNDTDGDIPLDILSINPVFRATVNGGAEASAEITILPNDLSTYQGTIASKNSVDFVLLFQVKSDVLSAVNQITLQMKTDGQFVSISL